MPSRVAPPAQAEATDPDQQSPRRGPPLSAPGRSLTAPADPTRLRIGELVGALQALLEPLEAGSDQERRLAYARCIPLLAELTGLREATLPLRRLKAAAHEAGWHLRALAGLAALKPRDDDQHAVWARNSLDEIAACARADPASPEPLP